METLLVTNDFPPKMGGIQSYLFELVNTLPPSSVRVLAPDYPGAYEFDAKLPYEVVRHPRLLYPTPRLLEKICELASGVDVVQFGYSLQSWLLAPVMKRRTGVPYVVFAHGAEVLFPLRFPGVSRLLMLGTLEKTASVFTVSSYTAGRMERYASGKLRCVTIPPIVDTVRFDPSKNGKKAEGMRKWYGIGEEPVILCVSRLVWRKGQDRLIEAMPEIHHRFGAKLLLVGEGKIEYDLRWWARQQGMEKQVIFCGRVEDGLLPAYYAAADVFAMPARDRWFGLEKEGFGVVYAEAAASGLPTVVGDSGGAREAVEDGETGFLVDGSERAKVREVLGRLLEDEDLRKRMGAAARERAVELHSPEAAGEKYRRALEEAARQDFQR